MSQSVWWHRESSARCGRVSFSRAVRSTSSGHPWMLNQRTPDHNHRETWSCAVLLTEALKTTGMMFPGWGEWCASFPPHVSSSIGLRSFSGTRKHVLDPHGKGLRKRRTRSQTRESSRAHQSSRTVTQITVFPCGIGDLSAQRLASPCSREDHHGHGEDWRRQRLDEPGMQGRVAEQRGPSQTARRR